jgi:hypothetical protein
MKLFPMIAQKYIGLATITRRWLGSMGSITTATPFLVLWILGRIANIAVLGSMGDDISLSFQIEKELFETSFSIRSIPETSFVDLLTALAVMPLAAFTTLAALGAGADPPDWIYEYNPRPDPSTMSSTGSSSLVKKGASVAVGAAATVAVAGASAAVAHGASFAQGLTGLGGSVPLAQSAGALHNARIAADAVPIDMLDQVDSLENLSRSIDAADQVRELHDDTNVDLATKAVDLVRTPSYDEPAITGLRKKE